MRLWLLWLGLCQLRDGINEVFHCVSLRWLWLLLLLTSLNLILSRSLIGLILLLLKASNTSLNDLRLSSLDGLCVTWKWLLWLLLLYYD